MNWLGIALFGLTYVLISARRLSWLPFDRPAGALLGAVACVVCGVLSPDQAIAAVNGPTLLLLFGVMGMGAFLGVDGFFDAVGSALVRHARTPARLLGAIIWGSGILSALLTNDAVCVLGAPIVVRLIERHRLAPLPFLLALATGSNTGSVATLVGNPQNMLCGVLGGLSYREHLVVVGPLALVCLALNHAWLRFVFRRRLLQAPLTADEPTTPVSAHARLTLGVVLATATAYTLGADLAWASVTGFVALMLIHRRDTATLWSRIDWSLLLFFAGLFVVVEALMQSGAPAWLFERFPLAGADGHANDARSWLQTSGLFLIGSNLVSNVPFILVVREQMQTLPNPTLAWEILAVASTFAGNLTLLGSVANVIVAENARRIGGLGFLDHLKVGLPLALVTTALGAVWLWALLPTSPS